MFNADNDAVKIEEYIDKHGEVTLCTSGVSMYPMLRHRKDMVVIKKAEQPFKKHDVPLYRLPSGKLVLHRILKVTDDAYIIRGDNLFKKEYVKREQVIGLLKSFYRNGKFCDCEKSFAYKCYIIYIRLSYPFRKIFNARIRPILSKIKHFLLG